MDSQPTPAIEARQVTQTFPGVRALDHVDLRCLPGRVHAMLGENGAGKSTLVRCLTGNRRPDGGEVRIAGTPAPLGSPRDALAQGVSAVYQELTVLPELTVGDNVMLGQERTRRGLLRRVEQRTRVRDALARVGLTELDPGVRAGALSLANRQLVEIARALVRRSHVLVLDEPSAVLSGDKLDALHRVVRDVAAEGTAVLYITHLLDEVEALADDVSILRDGRNVSTGPASAYDVDRMVREMVGRDVQTGDHGPARDIGDVVLRARGLVPHATSRPARPVDLTLRAGEIVGVAGLVGSGRSRLLRTLAGAHPADSGDVEVGGRTLGGSVRRAIQAGVVLVPEERKTDGLVLDLSAAANTTLTALPQIARAGWVSASRERAAYEQEQDRLGIRASGPEQQARQLSGGNQQKLVIAKWLRRTPQVLLLDEPTRGVDVGAKAELYRIIRTLAASGMSVLMASSELPEILGLADRVLVCRDGSVVGELSRDRLSEERIMQLALGTHDVEVAE